MSDVFISYARSTEAQARQIGDALRSLGYGVWRDDELPAHRSYAEVIEERLQAAKVVVVIWSAEAVKSEWVQSEADTARTDRKLVQLTVDESKLPRPFDRIQCADMTGWTGDLEAHGWKKVAASVAELISGASPSPGTAAIQPAVRGLSICVLPFANLSGDPEQEYFSDGISEDITTDLSKVSALEVTARNTAFGFKGKSPNIKEVAHQLGVSHVLEGSVRKAGSRVRITAQLIDGTSGNHLWAERYDRDLTDIFALQDEISQAIVAALKLKLLPEEKKAIERRGTNNSAAYNLYLMARRYYLGQSAKRRDLVVRLCKRAIDLDPTYARAWALLALVQTSRAGEAGEAGDAGLAAAERALALDPGLAEAHAARGGMLTRQGRYDEAWEGIEISLRLDPESNEVNSTAGLWAIGTQRYRDAIGYYQIASAADEADYSSPFMAMQCYEALGDQVGAQTVARQAVDRLERALASEPDNGALLAFGAGALVILGEIDRAKAWGEHALLLDPDDSTLRYNLACGMIRAGETDYALDLLEQSLEKVGRGNFRWAQADNDLDLVREHPRFKKIMAEAEARLAAGEQPLP